MDKISIKDYLIHSIKTELFLRKEFLIATFGILPNAVEHKGIGIKKNNDTVIVTVLDVEFQLEYNNSAKPIFEPNVKISLKKNELPMLHEDVPNTTVGALITNALVIQYPYQGKIPYVTGVINANKINTVAYEALSNDVVTIDEHLKFENAISNLKIFDTLVVPSATRKSITPSDDILKYRNELLVKYQGQMHDPAKVAEMQKLLADKYREKIKGDPSENYYISKKDINMVAMRTQCMIGAEPDFYDETKINVITKSLSEGWDVNDMQSIINSIRGGSYARGKETAMGGFEVKVSQRIFQNYTIAEEDCNTRFGLNIKLNALNYKNFVGNYLVSDKFPLDEQYLENNIGKYIYVRNPYGCLTGHTSNSTTFCKKCFGENVSRSEVGINAMTTTAISVFMQVFMALVHTSELSTARYNYLDRIV